MNANTVPYVSQTSSCRSEWFRRSTRATLLIMVLWLALGGLLPARALAAGFEPAAYDFGDVRVPDSAAQTVTLRNDSATDTLQVSTLSLVGPESDAFRLGIDTCTADTLVPGASCNVQVIFEPGTEGLKRTQLQAAFSTPDTLPVSMDLEGGNRPVLVKEIGPGTISGFRSPAVEMGGVLYFAGHDDSGMELWRSDGTEAGTELVKDIYLGAESSSPTNLTVVGSTLYFTARDEMGIALWKSGGTEANTERVKTIIPESTSSAPRGPTVVGDTLYFTVDAGEAGTALWKSNGAEESTVTVISMIGLRNLTTFAGSLFFTAKDVSPGRALWRTDGSEAGTERVARIHDSSWGEPLAPTAVGDTLFFAAHDDTLGYELWKTDGTAAGTELVKDINPEPLASSYPTQLTAFGDTLLFVAYDETAGYELWKSDGTEDGTVLVKDIYPGIQNREHIAYLTAVAGTLYFSADDGESGEELWQSDGTEDGTALVKDLNPGPASSAPHALTAVGDLLFFAATHSDSGTELWESDGTDAGTFMIQDLFPGPAGSEPDYLVPMGGKVYFSAANRGADFELWRFDADVTPALSSVPDQFTGGARDVRPIRIEVSDDEKEAADLTLTASSSNPALLPVDNIQIVPQAGGWDIKLIPSSVPGAGTSATVTLLLNDGYRTTTRTFDVYWYHLRVGGDGDYTSIQDAINGAVDGDTVLVAPGTYYEHNITFWNKEISVVSEAGPLATVVDAQSKARGFHIAGGQTRATVLRGFTIRNGVSLHEPGGGIAVVGSSPTVSECILEDNYAPIGGGMYVGGGQPLISGCQFLRNTAVTGGGGLAVLDSDAVEVTQSTFRENSAVYHGGGIWLRGLTSNPQYRIERSYFIRNQAGNAGGAIQIHGSADIENIVAFENEARLGGAVSVAPNYLTENHALCRIRHATLIRNHSVNSGGGIYGFAEENHGEQPPEVALTLENSIVWGNTAKPSASLSTGQADDADQVTVEGLASVEVSHSDIEAGYPGITVLGAGSKTKPEGGIIDADPRFALADDLRLLPDSPAIDGGSFEADPLARDIEGNKRPTTEGEHGLGSPDMGAFEAPAYEDGLPVIAVSPTSVEVLTEHGLGAAEAPSISVTNAGAGQLSWEAIVDDGDRGWLWVAPAEGESDGSEQAIGLYIDPVVAGALDPGVYHAEVEIRDQAEQAAARRVPVTMRVTRRLRVPNDYATIQDALDAVQYGDSVVLEQGTFSGAGNINLSLIKHDLVIESTSGPDKSIIDCQGSGPALRLLAETTIRGIGFQNCTTVGGGGAIYSQAPLTTLIDCAFELNSAAGNGGAVQFDGPRCIVRNSRFQGNSAGNGGAIAALSALSCSAEFTIESSEFTENQSIGSGGAIFARQSGVIRDSIFRGNTATEDHGGALASESFGFAIHNTGFVDNSAPNGTGGAIWSNGAQGQRIINSVFSNNSANEGGALWINNNSLQEIENSSFCNNSATSGPDLLVLGTEAMLSNTLFHSDDPPIVGGYQTRNCALYRPSGGAVAGFVELDAPPFLAPDDSNRPLSDRFRIVPAANPSEEKLIDKGTMIEGIYSDFRGSMRPLDGDGDGQAQFDIGAVEYSEYYGGSTADLPTKAFEDLRTSYNALVTGYEYEIKWSDRGPFPGQDPRLAHGGAYRVNLALVDDMGTRLELGTFELDITPLDYRVPYVFTPEQIGQWRLRLELAEDPSQFAISDLLTIDYKAVLPVPLGREIRPPAGADRDQRPDVERDDLVYWSTETRRLFAVAPGTTQVVWYADSQRANALPTVAQLVYPENPNLHVADSEPVKLLSDGTRFDGVEKKYADNDAGIGGNSFTASGGGWAVLLFRDADAEDPDEREVFEVVRTLVWDHSGRGAAGHPVLPIERDLDIGTAAAAGTAGIAELHDAECGSGHLFFEDGPYDGIGEARAHDRATRQGPIFAVNLDFTGPIIDPDDPKDDLVVVWYQQSDGTGVCWPSNPVRYMPRWPADAPTIVIADQQGSGPLAPAIYGLAENLVIYDQPDPDLPGYNPNEEHAAFFTAQGSEHPGVFPLRSDLNRADTSEPYALLKYRHPTLEEWRMRVFRVAAQSETFVVNEGVIEPADFAEQRYCLSGNGILSPRPVDGCADGYYFDADGRLVNPVDVSACYEWDGGAIENVVCPADGQAIRYDLDAQGALRERPQIGPGYALDQHGVIVDRDLYHRFHYRGTAGNEINAPYPLNQFAFGPCSESYIAPSTQDNALLDKDEKFFAFQGDVDIKLHYFYKLQPGFFYDLNGDEEPDRTVGSCVPWLEGLDGSFDGEQSIATTYAIQWPDPVPRLYVGETLIDAKTQAGDSVGLPNIGDQCIVDVLYDAPVVTPEGDMDYTRHSVNLLDPLKEFPSVEYILGDPGRDLPQSLKPKKDLSTQRWVFTALPYHLQQRLTYDEVDKALKLKGVYQAGVGEPMLLLNWLSARERWMIRNVLGDSSDQTEFMQMVLNVNEKAAGAVVYPADHYPSLKDAELKALTAGDAQGTGYVTLAFNNHEDCAAPTVLSVIRVECPLYTGDIKVIESPNPFEEKVTLKHNGDFGGESDSRLFQWKYRTATFSGIPDGPEDDPPGSWLEYEPVLFDPSLEAQNGYYPGAVDTVIQGTGQQLLPDKWFAARYQYDGVCPNTISPWTAPQLYEGWIKRVMKKINLYDQKVTDFHAAAANTTASMISLAGQRYEGDIALGDDPDYLQDLGMIEVYETLLNRGQRLTEDGGDFTDLNKALLFAASRVAGLYMLIGNEAYADATDPTIGFSTASGIYGTEAPSIFSFQNQVDSLIDEELTLLRGRDDLGVRPFYNRLIWNFTLGDGEVAYKESYNITDQDEDGDIDEYDAQAQYPQGHGDAWGHYLSAIKTYYRLLKRQNFTWIPQSEAILVAGTPVAVDYRDERKFANAAAARARTGAEVVALTYREHYSEDPDDQWQGYPDHDSKRAWGVDGWSRRAGQGAYFDWVVGNAMLPSKDPVSCTLVSIDPTVTVDNCHDGIAEVDRSKVLELAEIARNYAGIEAEVDKADAGLNPLGLATDAIPFDIDPARVAQGETHFEQIYGRAAQAMNNAIAVFNHANQSSQLLRRQQDSLTDFKRNIENMEADYNNRLIELYGYPYSDDCGPGKTYSTDDCETQPDLYHYMVVDPSYLMGEQAPKVHEFEVVFADLGVRNDGGLERTDKPVTFHVDTDSRFGIIKPPDWRGRRKAPGELQLTRSDLLQQRGRFEMALVEYDNLVVQIEDQVELLKAQYDINADEIAVLRAGRGEQNRLNAAIFGIRATQFVFRTAAVFARGMGNAVAEAFPKSVGFSNDVTSVPRSLAKASGMSAGDALGIMADFAGLAETGLQQSKEDVGAAQNIKLTDLRGRFAARQQLLQLEGLVRGEANRRHELHVLAEGLQQSGSRYLAALAKGDRLLADRLRFRRQTAAQIQDYRYKDMTFRIFRNDALEKYRAQFDMAAMYVYLAAKAYDYETTLLDYHTMAGQRFLSDIVRQRSIGQIENGQPLTGSGLADPMRRMWQNFQVLKPQLGFNNPQQETNRFSLRQELFRIKMDQGSNETWQRALEGYRVDNLWEVPEFRRYVRPFGSEGIREPGLVIPFSTTVTSGLNYFRWPLAGGDSYYSSSNFATKVRSVGVWFSNYNTVGLAQTPRVYLVPVGEDVLRTPSYDVNEIRTWHVVDQKLPVPFPIVETEMAGDPGWIPTVDTLYDEMFEIRRHSDFRAYHDSGYLNESEMQYDSRLIGRSVWNNRWLLIIPGRNLLYDPEEGLETLIYGPALWWGSPDERTGNGISDIKLFFETSSYSGN